MTETKLQFLLASQGSWHTSTNILFTTVEFAPNGLKYNQTIKPWRTTSISINTLAKYLKHWLTSNLQVVVSRQNIQLFVTSSQVKSRVLLHIS